MRSYDRSTIDIVPQQCQSLFNFVIRERHLDEGLDHLIEKQPVELLRLEHPEHSGIWDCVINRGDDRGI